MIIPLNSYVVAALCPSKDQVGHVGVKLTDVVVTCTLRKRASREPALDGLVAHPYLLCDRMLRHPLLMELDHLLIASHVILLIDRWECFRCLRTPGFSFW